jgi:hypothetical protein
MKIQYKCQVPIYVFPDMKLRGFGGEGRRGTRALTLVAMRIVSDDARFSATNTIND